MDWIHNMLIDWVGLYQQKLTHVQLWAYVYTVFQKNGHPFNS